MNAFENREHGMISRGGCHLADHSSALGFLDAEPPVRGDRTVPRGSCARLGFELLLCHQHACHLEEAGRQSAFPVDGVNTRGCACGLLLCAKQWGHRAVFPVKSSGQSQSCHFTKSWLSFHQLEPRCLLEQFIQMSLFLLQAGHLGPGQLSLVLAGNGQSEPHVLVVFRAPRGPWVGDPCHVS